MTKIILAPAAGDGIGGGHVMRCLALAKALSARGADCAFAVNAAGQLILERFSGRRWDYAEADAGGDVLIVDDYTMAAGREGRLKESVRLLTIIDDLADRPHLADLLVDPGDGRAAADYGGLLPPETRVLAGPDYALIRPAFAEARAKRALAVKPEVERIFVSFGLSDVGGITVRAVNLLLALAPGVPIDVAMPASSESLARLALAIPRNPGLTLHLDALDVAGLLLEADVAVGAGGASTWERCCMGVPSVAVAVADNQRALVERLNERGVVLGIDYSPGGRVFEDLLGAAFLKLRNPALRARLAAASREACDGLGAARVAEAILDQLATMRSPAGS